MPVHFNRSRTAFCKAPFMLSMLNFKGLFHSKLPHHCSGNCCTSVPAVITSLPWSVRGPRPAAVRTHLLPQPDKQVLLPGSNSAPEQRNPQRFSCKRVNCTWD